MTMRYYPMTNTSVTSTSTNATFWQPITTSGTSSTAIITSNGTSIGTWIDDGAITTLSGNLKVATGNKINIELPDGAVLEIQADGSYKLFDDKATVVYKANRVREFNRYINSSDLLEEFIKFVSKQGNITKKEFFNLPVELFIQWLVIRAGEADGEDADYNPVTQALPLALPNFKKRHSVKCKCCGKFITKREMEFCNQDHMLTYVGRRNLFK